MEPTKGTYYYVTDQGVTTRYKFSFAGLRAYLRQAFCPHPHELQKMHFIGEPDITAQLCKRCGWARSAPSIKKEG